jgi:hypothetical protein
MRQYAIFYKRGTGGKFSRIKPNENAKLIDHEEVRETVAIAQQHPFIEGLMLRMEDEIFNVVSFDQEAIAPDAFQFTEE